MKIKRKPTEIPASLKTVDIKALLRKRGIPLMKRLNQEMKVAALPMARQLIKNRQNGTPAPKQIYSHFTNDEALAYWEKQIHIIEVLEKRFDLKVQQFITKMVTGYLAHLEIEITTTKKFKNINKGYFDDNEDDLMTQAQLDFTPLLIDQAVLAGQEAYKLIKVDDIYTPYKLREQIAKNVEKFTQSMLDTDRQTLIDIVTNGIKDGKSVPEIRGAIQADFDNITKSQAQRITRTEVLRASNQATLDAYQQSGVVEGKQWLTAGAVDECADYEGKIEALDGSFYSDTDEFADGDPPLHPNCKCVLLPVLINEKGYAAPVNKKMLERIKELEAQIDKRTRDFKSMQSQRHDDELYIKSLEKHLGVDNDRTWTQIKEAWRSTSC